MGGGAGRGAGGQQVHVHFPPGAGAGGFGGPSGGEPSSDPGGPGGPNKAWFRRHMARSFQQLHRGLLAQQQAQPQQQRTQQVPFPVPITHPFAGQPVAVTSTGGTEAVKAKPSIVIKQISRQEVGTRKAKKRRVTKSNKQSLKQKKGEYMKLKRDLRSRLAQQKKASYSAEAERIKSLPSTQRVAARKALRARLKKVYDEKLRQLPNLGKRNYNDIVALINKLRKIRW